MLPKKQKNAKIPLRVGVEYVAISVFLATPGKSSKDISKGSTPIAFFFVFRSPRESTYFVRGCNFSKHNAHFAGSVGSR